ncbi:MAG: DUF4340 domain-containing protein [Verrucomicrobiota bacterium]|nr:DUF4340 domain-containing protein [Verrucomicrobiota bacterium]
MKGKNLVVLVVVAVILVGLAYLSSTRNRKPPASLAVIGKPAVHALQDTDTLNNVERLTFRSAGSTVAVARVSDAWVVPAKYGYPADYDKVSDFVRKVRDLKVGQCVGKERKQLEDLNLLSPAEATGTNAQTGALVELADKDGKMLASMVVGKEHRRSTPDSPFGAGYPDGRFVAVDGRAYLVADTLDGMPANDKDWLDADLVNVSASDLTEIEIKDAAGKTLTLKRAEGGGDLKVGDLGEKEEMDAAKVGSLAGILSYLRFNDVADPKLTDEATGFDKAVTVTARAKDQKVYTMKIGAKPSIGNDRHIRLSVAMTPATEPKDAEPVKPDAAKADEKKSDDAKAADDAKKKEDREKAEKDARDLNAKLRNWTYIVAKHKVDAAGIDPARGVERKAFVKTKEEKRDAASAQEGQKKGDAKETKEENKKEKKGFLQRLFGWGDDKVEAKPKDKESDTVKDDKP